MTTNLRDKTVNELISHCQWLQSSKAAALELARRLAEAEQKIAERNEALGELDDLLCNIFIRRTKVESILRNNRKIGKSLSPEECLELADQLSIPTFPEDLYDLETALQEAVRAAKEKQK